MTPYYADDWLTVYHGDSRAVMGTLPAESVHCVVTSPPYWGLRDYGVDDQLGLEATPEAYVANMVDVFREVRRVLRSDGTVWLNLGDSYATGTATQSKPSANNDVGYWNNADKLGRSRIDGRESGLKPKDIVGIPWRVAFALQADGWYLRSDIIWSKPNPMPESVTDRPTKAHEYVFLLAKSARYYFDADAVREPAECGRSIDRDGNPYGPFAASTPIGEFRGGSRAHSLEGGRNIRSVWTIPTAPYPGAHFATFPPKLVEPCVKAGTSERGVCPDCGAPWQRIVEVRRNGGGSPAHSDLKGYSPTSVMRTNALPVSTTTGWRPSCRHDAEPVPATVLDCFAGSGTTGMVAQSLSRRAILIDLSMDYLGQLMERNRDIPLGLGA